VADAGECVQNGLPRYDTEAADTAPALRISGLRKRFGDTLAVDDLHLSVPRGDGATVQPAQLCGVGQQLPPGQPLGQCQPVGQHPDQLLGAGRVLPDVQPEDPHVAGIGPQQSDGHRQRGRLAGPVGADQPEERAARHRQPYADGSGPGR
jgi:hypothetical protein